MIDIIKAKPNAKMGINSAGDRDEESPVGHHSCPVKIDSLYDQADY
jgi:hypothetical protein